MQQSLEALSKEQLQSWEDALIAYMYQAKWQQSWDGHTVPKDIVKSICAHSLKLSNAFTLARENLEPNYFNKKDVQFAYLLYFHLANVVRVAACLKPYLERYFKQNPEKNRLQVLDLGSGWGASAWALDFLLKNYWPDVKANVLLTDQNHSILKQSKNLFSYMQFSKTSVNSKIFDLSTQGHLKILHQKQPYDLVIAANAINEVSEQSQDQLTRIFTILWKYHLSNNGAIAIVEPALNATSRQLTCLRDQWLEAWEDAYSPFPCMHQARCPMNSDKKDWCHFETQWPAPNLRKKIERYLDHKDKSLKASYIILSKVDMYKNSKDPLKFRVLSNELKHKHGRFILVCTPSGKQLVELDKGLKKNTFTRGDTVHLELDQPS